MRALMLVLFTLFSFSADAAENTIRFKTGEMELSSFVEMAAGALAINVNASALESLRAVITSSVAGPFTQEQGLTQLMSVLALQGIALVHDEDLEIYRIMRVRDARDANIPLILDPAQLPDNDLQVNHVFKMKYFPAEMMARNLRSFAPANARLIPDEATNSVLITDVSRSMAKYRDLISRLDTPRGADDAKTAMASRAKVEICPSAGSVPGNGINNNTVMLVMFSLIGLILGFLIRGYVIRRIEGGL